WISPGIGARLTLPHDRPAPEAQPDRPAPVRGDLWRRVRALAAFCGSGVEDYPARWARYGRWVGACAEGGGGGSGQARAAGSDPGASGLGGPGEDVGGVGVGAGGRGTGQLLGGGAGGIPVAKRCLQGAVRVSIHQGGAWVLTRRDSNRIPPPRR